MALSATAYAQEPWSLRRCIDYAIEHNIDIRQAANQAEQSAVEVNTAKWARLPNLNGSANQSWNWGRTQTAVPDEAATEPICRSVPASLCSPVWNCLTNTPLPN